MAVSIPAAETARSRTDYLEATMFIGHFALAFGAKQFAPKVSLGILFLACQLADIIWPNLVLLGI